MEKEMLNRFDSLLKGLTTPQEFESQTLEDNLRVLSQKECLQLIDDLNNLEKSKTTSSPHEKQNLQEIISNILEEEVEEESVSTLDSLSNTISQRFFSWCSQQSETKTIELKIQQNNELQATINFSLPKDFDPNTSSTTLKDFLYKQLETFLNTISDSNEINILQSNPSRLVVNASSQFIEIQSPQLTRKDDKEQLKERIKEIRQQLEEERKEETEEESKFFNKPLSSSAPNFRIDNDQSFVLPSSLKETPVWRSSFLIDSPRNKIRRSISIGSRQEIENVIKEPRANPVILEKKRDPFKSSSLGRNSREIRNEKQIAFQIGALIGKPLVWVDDSIEISLTRDKLFKLFDVNNLKFRKMSHVFDAVTLSIRWPSYYLPTKILIKVYFSDRVKTVKCDVNEKVIDVISKLLKSITPLMPQLQKVSPEDYILKIGGKEEYVMKSDCSIGSIKHVRKCVQTNQSVKFELIELSSVEALLEDSETLESIRNVDIKKYEFFGESINTEKKFTPSRQINRAFEVKIIRLENFIPPEEDNDAFLFISIGLYYGNQLLCPQVQSQPVSASNPTWDQWLKSSISYCDIPTETRLCIVVNLVKASNKTTQPYAWVNYHLIDFEGKLKDKKITLSLWSDMKPNPTSSCILNINPKAIKLQLEFFQFPVPLLYPMDHNYRTQSNLNRIFLPSTLPNYTPTEQERLLLEKLIKTNILYKFNSEEKVLLWKCRKYLSSRPSALSKVLLSVDWKDPSSFSEVDKCLQEWISISASDAIYLLGGSFPYRNIRDFAVDKLNAFSDTDLMNFLFQLIQVLKYEPFHDSMLARFLLKRALLNRHLIGNSFFWYLQGELEGGMSDRYSLLLEIYLRGCGEHRNELVKQLEVVGKIIEIGREVKEAPPAKRQEILQQNLNSLRLPAQFRLPTNPSQEMSGLIISQCKLLDSVTFPLKLVFENSSPIGESISILYKQGDDLRTDILTLKMFSLMEELWSYQELDFELSIYTIVPLKANAGLIEMIPNARTTADIQKQAGGITAVFAKTPIANWLRENCKTDKEYQFAVYNFLLSCAGYCVATYVIGIGDRHNDNIMIDQTGHLFHIDFAHFLGNIMKWKGIKREKAPFVFTPEFLFVLGGEKSPLFQQFVHLCCIAYNILRKHHSLFINQFDLMLTTGIPQLNNKEDIEYLSDAFSIDQQDEEAKNTFTKLIFESLHTKTTQLMFAVHILAHPD